MAYRYGSIFAILALAAMAGSAQAATTAPQILSFGVLGQTDQANPGNPQTLTFNGFDGSLGTLTAVNISLSSSGEGSLSMTLSGGTPNIDWANGFASTPLAIIGPDAGTLFSGSASGITHNCVADVTGGCTASAALIQSGGNGAVLLNAGFAPYMASTFDLLASVGPFAPPPTADSTLCAHSNNSGTATCDTQANYYWGGEVTVSFDYVTTEAVPEPASLALLAAGLAGLGAIRRRR